MALTLPKEMALSRLSHCCTALKQQLGTSPYWSIRHLVCQIDRDRITVQGTVSSFYLKQIAQSLAAKVVGVECMCSEIEVQLEEPSSQGKDE